MRPSPLKLYVSWGKTEDFMRPWRRPAENKKPLDPQKEKRPRENGAPKKRK